MHVWSEMQCLGLSRSLYRLSVPHQGDKLFSVLDTDVGKSTWQGKFLPPALPSHKLELCAAPLTAAKPLGFPFPAVRWEHVFPPSHSAGEAVPSTAPLQELDQHTAGSPCSPLGCN